MIKVNRIKLSGFRGILIPQELNLSSSGGIPISLALFGSNSSGKTSFVDGLEWFLSPHNKIDWLQREDAQEKAYPHQEAKEGESYVEVEFYNDKASQALILRKTFDVKRVTKPVLSSEADFVGIYNSFVIRPYLRYQEVINFVYNSTGAEKYQTLANWMGFEEELAFQEKIALRIIPTLESQELFFTKTVEQTEKTLKELINSQSIEESNIVDFCLKLISPYTGRSFTNIIELSNCLVEIEKLKTSTSAVQNVANLTRIEVALRSASFDLNLKTQCSSLQIAINGLLEKKEHLGKIDAIDLYTKALDILIKESSSDTRCPVCGIDWKRAELKSHIEAELALLKSVKEIKDTILQDARKLKISLQIEQQKVGQVLSYYSEIAKIISTLDYPRLRKYRETLFKINSCLEGNIFEVNIGSLISEEDIMQTREEESSMLKLIAAEKKKIEPSQEDLKLNDTIERLKKINETWISLCKIKEKKEFFTAEINKFLDISKEIATLIHQNIVSRFNQLSESIRKYFGILRKDKEIKDINIVLNLEKGRATGRSAEIQLSYYNVSTKPAYKVLSESLLNSLGLAIYFTCIKQFNTQGKFVVLDDIMNSLDMGHRDTLLDLISQEFADYQIILFTHDLYWFQKIQKRFPDWSTKKIKGWDYKSGPKIDLAKINRDEVNELLQDSTKIEQAGILFTRRLEGILNELCENLHAKLKHRFMKSDPPSLEELFEALQIRLEEKLGKNHIITGKVINSKKFERLLRNFTAHARDNSPASISQEEVKRAIEEWDKVEVELCCSTCNRYVEYLQTQNRIECRCGSLKIK